jgi:hypothetical protein
MARVDELQANVRSVLESVWPLIEAMGDFAWHPSDGFLPVARRAIAVRQFDSLDSIAHLVGEERGHAATTLLRPCCEELIWTKYLAVIAPEHAEELLRCVASIEQLDSLKAQDEYGGRTVTKELGLYPFLESSLAGEAAVRSRLRVLGEELAWPRRTIESGRPPVISWLAKETNQQAVYKYLYHATSRFVHFSAAELLRRAWGRPGRLSVRSMHFRDYWGAFALRWGLRLFIDTMIELCETPGMPETELNGAELMSAAEGIAAFGQVPIITAEELEWPD